jgi:hypothetical protein
MLYLLYLTVNDGKMRVSAASLERHVRRCQSPGDCMTLKSRGALRRRVLGDETLEIGAPINFAGASLEELRDKEDLPGDFVRR